MHSDPGQPSRSRLENVILVVALAAMAFLAVLPILASGDTDLADSAGAFHPDGWEGASPEFDRNLYNPVSAGEALPDGYRPVLARDGIRPVYNPVFVSAANSSWPDDELIIGVEIEGDARAYPVGFLNRREIVVDMHRGIPTFVTW